MQLRYIVLSQSDAHRFMPVFEGGQTGMLSVRALFIQASASALALLATPAFADDPPAAAARTDDAGVSMNLDVLAKQLDIARQQIQPSLGATTYTFSPQALEEFRRGPTPRSTRCCCRRPAWRRTALARSICAANMPTCSTA